MGVAVWSLMTALCGAAHSFWGLLLARIGVGAGEAALSPAAYSLIPDLFAPEHRSRAQGVYGIGRLLRLGPGLPDRRGDHRGGVEDGAAQPALFGEIGGWRLVFFVVGLPGVLVALAVLAIVEPARQAKRHSTSEVMGELRREWRAYGTIFIGCTVINIAFHALSAWGPAMLGRVHHLPQTQVGLVMGLAYLGPGCIALVLGGAMADRALKAGRADGNLVNALVGALLVAASLGVLVATPSTAATIAMIWTGVFGLMLTIGARRPACWPSRPRTCAGGSRRSTCWRST